MNETLSSSNGFAPPFDDSAAEDKPMLHAKMNGTSDDQGITALINRQLQGNYIIISYTYIYQRIAAEGRRFTFDFLVPSWYREFCRIFLCSLHDSMSVFSLLLYKGIFCKALRCI